MFPRARDRAGFTPNKQAEIKERINTHSDRLNRVLTAIQTSSLGRLENKVEDVMTKADLDTVMSRLNEIHSDVLRGRRAHSILTDGDEWSILEQELLGDDNITEVDVAVNRDEILLWLERVRNSKDLQDLLQGVSQYGGSVRDDSNSDENGRNTPVNADGAHCAVVEEADDSEEGEEQEEVMTGRIDVQDLDETNQDDDSRHEQAEDEKREHDEENEDQTDESEVEAVQNDEESEEEQSAGGESKWEESETGDERVEESNIKLVEESENEIKGEESEADKSDVTMENQPEECEGEETEESEDEHVGQSNDRESERGEDSGVANQSDDTQAEESENENEQITEREDEQVEESEIESTEESELEESESEQGEDSECDSEQIEESANRPTGETETRQIEEAQATRSSETEGERVQESQDERSDEAESKQIEEDQHGQCGEGQVSENRAEQLDERERNQVQEILEIPYHIPEGQETNQTTDESLGGEDSSSDVGSDTSFRTAIHVSTSTPESEVLTDEEEQTEGEGFYTGDDRSWTEDDIAWTEDDWTDNEEEPERPLDINITPLTAACTWYPGTQVVGDPESNKSFVWLPGAFAFPPPEVEMVIRLHISLEEAYYGTTRKINLTRSVWDDETQSTRSETSPINLDMQKGIMDGSWVRYDGMGNEGQNTSQDLIFIVSEVSLVRLCFF